MDANAETRTESKGTEAEARRIIAIGSGKGGAGSSVITANLAIFLAQIGKRVTIVDADWFESGVHTWLGMDPPERTLLDVRQGRFDSVQDVLVDTPVTGLTLLTAAPSLNAALSWPGEITDFIARQIQRIESEFVLVDLPAGIHPLSLELFTSVDMPVLVSVAAPDAVEATYRFLVASFAHKLMKSPEMHENARRAILRALRDSGHRANARTLMETIWTDYPDLHAAAEAIHQTFHPQVIVNQVRVKADEGLGDAVVSAAIRWLGLGPKLLGVIESDDNVWLSQRRGIPLLIDFPQSKACKGLERIIRKLLSQNLRDLYAPTPLPPPTAEQSLYDLLEIYPGASEEEVRRALKRIRDLFGIGAVAVRGACNDEERQDYQRRAEDAHATLVDKSKRRQYDRETFPEGFPSYQENTTEDLTDRSTKPPRPHDSLPEVSIADDQVVDGHFLGQVRRERGVELVDISNRAKISLGYLRAIEEENFSELPAPVYIRGFITEFARYLKVDPKRAVSDFVAKYEAHRNRKKK